MDNLTFWVGQVPSQSLIIVVYDEYGNPNDLSGYTSIRMKMVGPGGRKIEDVGTVTVQSARNGRLLYNWPARSLFTERGQYVMQLELSGPTVKDFTNSIPFNVRELGKVNK